MLGPLLAGVSFCLSSWLLATFLVLGHSGPLLGLSPSLSPNPNYTLAFFLALQPRAHHSDPGASGGLNGVGVMGVASGTGPSGFQSWLDVVLAWCPRASLIPSVRWR